MVEPGLGLQNIAARAQRGFLSPLRGSHLFGLERCSSMTTSPLAVSQLVGGFGRRSPGGGAAHGPESHQGRRGSWPGYGGSLGRTRQRALQPQPPPTLAGGQQLPDRAVRRRWSRPRPQRRDPHRPPYRGGGAGRGCPWRPRRGTTQTSADPHGGTVAERMVSPSGVRATCGSAPSPVSGSFTRGMPAVEPFGRPSWCPQGTETTAPSGAQNATAP